MKTEISQMVDNPKIVWEKYESPIKKLEMKKDPEEWEGDEIEGGISVLMSPMGMIPVQDFTDFTDKCKIWTGYSNFTISAPIKAIIENTEGVEILNLLSRYRFQVGVGTLFADREIMHRVQENILRFLKNLKCQDIKMLSK